jgi:rod shape-determining protein MreC
MLAVPLKALLQRFAFGLLAATAITLMVLSRAEPQLIERLRTGITDASAPILQFFSQPAASVASAVDEIDAVMTVHEQNAALRDENTRLLKWQAVAQRLAHENEVLQGMLNVVPDPRATFVTARVIGDSGGPFVRTALVNAGTADGARKGLAVINGEGLVGRLVEAGERSARILLLTDLNSRIPVVMESSRDRAILAGDNTRRPRLEFLAVDSRAAVGDRVVTSGEGGVFPPGLPIGIVSSIREDGVLVQPFVDWDRLEYVSVLDYTLPGVLPSTRRAERVGSLR